MENNAKPTETALQAPQSAPSEESSKASLPMPQKQKKVVQSYNVTIMRGKLTAMQVRILARIVEKCQPAMRAQARSLLEAINKGQLQSPSSDKFAFTAQELMNNKSHNYTALRRAINDLQKRVVQYYDYNERKWYSASLISEAEMETNTGRTILTCPRWLLDYICNFNAGAKVYDIVKALQFKRASSARLYMLLAGQSMPITYKIDQLRKILGATEKYGQTRDFIKRNIEPAKQEMAERNANGFNYTLNKASDAKNATIESITFHPIKREYDSEKTMLAKLTARNLIPAQFHDYLLQQLQFTSKELNANKEKLVLFCRRPTWAKDFAAILERARRKRKGKGYIMAAIKSVVKEGK